MGRSPPDLSPKLSFIIEEEEYPSRGSSREKQGSIAHYPTTPLGPPVCVTGTPSQREEGSGRWSKHSRTPPSAENIRVRLDHNEGYPSPRLCREDWFRLWQGRGERRSSFQFSRVVMIMMCTGNGGDDLGILPVSSNMPCCCR